MAPLALVACALDGELEEDFVLDGVAHRGDYGVLYLRWDGGGGTSYCTATLIHPRVALTAGHCVYDAGFDGQGRRVRDPVKANEDEVNLLVGNHTATARPYAGYGADRSVETIITRYSECLRMDCDVAARVLSSAGYVRPLPLDQTDVPVAEDELTYIGFGKIVDSSTSNGLGIKRKGTTEIGNVTDGYFTTGVLLCHGDSGGPALVDGRVVGIASNATDDRTTTCAAPNYWSLIHDRMPAAENSFGNHEVIAEALALVGGDLEDHSQWPAQDQCMDPDLWDRSGSNETVATAASIGTLGDQDEASHAIGTLHHRDDVDYYRVRLTDGLGTLAPAVSLSPVGLRTREWRGETVIDVEHQLCAAFVRDSGVIAEPSCAGDIETADDGTAMCCVSPALGAASAEISFGVVDQKGLIPIIDSGTLLIRVRRIDGSNDCGEYTLSFGGKG